MTYNNVYNFAASHGRCYSYYYKIENVILLIIDYLPNIKSLSNCLNMYNNIILKFIWIVDKYIKLIPYIENTYNLLINIKEKNILIISIIFNIIYNYLIKYIYVLIFLCVLSLINGYTYTIFHSIMFILLSIIILFLTSYI